MYGNYRRRYRKYPQKKKTYKTYPKYNKSVTRNSEVIYKDFKTANDDGTESFIPLEFTATGYDVNRKVLAKYINVIMQLNSAATTSVFFRVSLLWINHPQWYDDIIRDALTDYYDTSTLTYAEGAPRKYTTMSRAITLMDKTIKLADNDDGGQDIRFIKKFIKLNKYIVINAGLANLTVDKGLPVLVFGTTATTPANVGVKYQIRLAYCDV